MKSLFSMNDALFGSVFMRVLDVSLVGGMHWICETAKINSFPYFSFISFPVSALFFRPHFSFNFSPPHLTVCFSPCVSRLPLQ
jgi:hypothetical protein